jgi:hypothetical protein
MMAIGSDPTVVVSEVAVGLISTFAREGAEDW